MRNAKDKLSLLTIHFEQPMQNSKLNTESQEIMCCSKENILKASMFKAKKLTCLLSKSMPLELPFFISALIS